MSRLCKGSKRGLSSLGPTNGRLLHLNAMDQSIALPFSLGRGPQRFKTWMSPTERKKKYEERNDFLRKNQLGRYCEDNFKPKKLNITQKRALNSHIALSIQHKSKRKKITLPTLKFMKDEP